MQTRPRCTHFARRPNAPINADTLFPPARSSANAPFGKQSLMFAGGSYKYLPTPGSGKAAQVFCMTKPHPFQMGYNLHLQRGGRFLTPTPCGAANTHNYTKNKASCCRLPRQSFKQRFLADSRFPLQLSVGFSILTSCRLLVFGLLLLQFGGWCRFRRCGTASVRGERLRLKTKRIQPLSRCIRAALVSLNRCLSLCLCRLLLQTDNSSTASRLTLRLRALSVLPAPHAEHRHERRKAFWDFEFYSN